MISKANSSALLKQVYAKKLGDVLHKEKAFPLWNILKKKKGTICKLPTGGNAFVNPVKVSGAHTYNPGFSASQTAAAANVQTVVTFQSTLKNAYVIKQVDGIMQALTSGDEGAFVDALDFATEEALRDMRLQMARFVYGSGYGKVGTITAAPTTSSIKIDPANLGLIEHGMPLVASQSEAGHVLRSATILTITSVAHDGTLGLSGNPQTASWANGDTIFLSGTRENSATPSRFTFHGLEGINPVTAPVAAESFDMVDRSVNYKLGGLRFVATDFSSTAAAAIHACQMLQIESSNPSHMVWNPTDYAKFVATLDSASRGSLPMDSTERKFGFAGITLVTGSGEVKCIADPGCPKGTARIFDENHLHWLYAGDDIIEILESPDGSPFFVKDTADAYEVRVRTIPELVTDQPNSLAVISGIA
jgi:hypothetical protein